MLQSSSCYLWTYLFSLATTSYPFLPAIQLCRHSIRIFTLHQFCSSCIISVLIKGLIWGCAWPRVLRSCVTSVSKHAVYICSRVWLNVRSRKFWLAQAVTSAKQVTRQHSCVCCWWTRKSLRREDLHHASQLITLLMAEVCAFRLSFIKPLLSTSQIRCISFVL